MVLHGICGVGGDGLPKIKRAYEEMELYHRIVGWLRLSGLLYGGDYHGPASG